MNIVIALAFSFFLSAKLYAAPLVVCKNVYINDLWVESNREDAGSEIYGDKLFLSLVKESGEPVLCNDKSYVYLANEKPAYNGFLSLALSAISLGKKVDVYINPSADLPIASELAVIRLGH